MRNVQKVRSSNQFGVSSLPQKVRKKVEKNVEKKRRGKNENAGKKPGKKTESIQNFRRDSKFESVS